MMRSLNNLNGTASRAHLVNGLPKDAYAPCTNIATSGIICIDKGFFEKEVVGTLLEDIFEEVTCCAHRLNSIFFLIFFDELQLHNLVSRKLPLVHYSRKQPVNSWHK